jgi:hypothetical protein
MKKGTKHPEPEEDHDGDFSCFLMACAFSVVVGIVGVVSLTWYAFR